MENQEHIHSFEDIVVPATCQQQGYTLHRCACGYEYKDHFVPVGNHDFQVTEQLDPTCTTPGQQTLHCKTCGATETRPVPALGHSWGQWNVRVVPTCTENGVQFRTCDRCGETEEQVIKAKGHTLTNPRKSETKKGVTEYFCPDCGQTVQKKSLVNKKLIIAIATVLAVVMLAVLVVPSQAYYYYMGKYLISIGQYEKAYYTLQGCVETDIPRSWGYSLISGDRTEKTYYKDTEKILGDFLFLCEEYTGFNSKITYKEEKFYDEELNQIFYSTTRDNIYKNEYTDVYEDGRLTETLHYVDSLFDGRTEYSYDENGNRTLAVRYDADGKMDSKDEYEYDKDGNCTLEVKYDADGKIKYKYEYEYDKDGNRTLLVNYDADGKIDYKYEYEYDKDGKRTHRIHYQYGEIWYKDEYEYDKDGNCTLVLEYYYNSFSYELSGKTKAKYKGGNLTHYSSYNSNGKLRYTIECEYDKNGNMTRATHYDADGKKISEENWEGFTVVYLPATGK